MEIRNPWQLLFPEPPWKFYRGLYKKVRNIKVGHWKISQFEFSIMFGRDAMIKEE